MKFPTQLFVLTTLTLLLHSACNNNPSQSGKQLAAVKTIEDSLRDKGADLLDSRMPDSALVILKDVLSKHPTEETKAEVISNIGNAYWEKQDFPGALRNYLQAIAIFRRLNMPFRVAQVEANCAGTFESMGVHDIAMQYATRALRVFEKDTGFENEIEYVLTVLGNLHNSIENFPGARDYHSRVLTMRIARKDTFGVAVSKNNLGIAYQKMGRLDSALKLFLEYRLLARYLKDKSRVGRAFENLAKTYLLLGRRDIAWSSSDSALRIFSDVSSKVGLANIHLIRAEYLKSENVDRAYSEAMTAVIYGDSAQIIEPRVRALTVLSEISAAKGKFLAAYEYHRRSTSLNDSVLGSQKVSRIFALEQEYLAEKMQVEIGRIERENRQLEFAKESRTRQLVLALTGLIGSMIIVYLLFRRYTEKKRFSVTLENQNGMLQSQNIALKELHDELENENSKMTQKVSTIVSETGVYVFKDAGTITYRNIVKLIKRVEPMYKNDAQICYFDQVKERFMHKMEYDRSLKYFDSDPDGALPDYLFAQITQQCIVNMRRLSKTENLGKWEFYLDDENIDKPVVIKVSRTYREEFERRYAKFKNSFR